MAGAKKVLKRKVMKKNKETCKFPGGISKKTPNNVDTQSKNTDIDSKSPEQSFITNENSVFLRDSPIITKNDKPHVCPYCDFQTYSSHLLSNHKRRHNIRQPWACTKCSFSTSSEYSLQRHVELIHEKPQDLFCVKCDFKCSKHNELKNHMLVHTSKNYYQCSKCDYKHVKLAIIKRHMIIHLDNTVQFKCFICGYKGVKAEYLTRHMEKHHKFELDLNRSLEILDTSKENVNVNYLQDNDIYSLTTDKKNIIEKQPVVLLRRCDDDINDSNNSAVNIGVIHEQILQDNFLDVAHCGEQEEINPELLNYEQQDDNSLVFLKSTLITKSKNSITSIVKIVDSGNSSEPQFIYNTGVSTPPVQPEPILMNEVVYNKANSNTKTADLFRCKECSFVSTWFDQFERHLKFHTITFSCDDCDFKSNSKISLAKHKQLKHRQQKDFQCKKCDYKCSSSQYLKAHLMSHVKVKRFKCENCHTMYKTAAALKCHMKIHDEEKPHACDLCDFRTKYKHSLKNHMFIHTGETNHVCEICNYKFYSSCQLKKHMEVHDPLK